ncbi:MAG TPA: TetR/AcrR family transcriptional regulator [Saprospiraceae bacterium]|nr:TetR/AcrR family transcriptional regulator [Saprospiraceae bacterium]
MSPKTNEQFAAMRRESQEKIEAAALRLFAEKGYHNTSISAIARAAGVSKGLLYNYYDGKDDLLDSLINHAIDDNSEEIEAFLQSELPPFEKIKAVTEAAVQMVVSDPSYWKLLTALALQQDVIAHLKESLDQKKAEMIQTATVLFEQMGYTDPEKEAFLYGATMDGLMLHYLSLGGQYPMEAMKDYIIEKYKL